jgi:hypothetical protein
MTKEDDSAKRFFGDDENVKHMRETARAVGLTQLLIDISRSPAMMGGEDIERLGRYWCRRHGRDAFRVQKCNVAEKFILPISINPNGMEAVLLVGAESSQREQRQHRHCRAVGENCEAGGVLLQAERFKKTAYC